MTRLLDLRIDARTEAMTQVETILDRAADRDDAELTDAEEETLTQLRSGIETLDAQIAVLQGDADRAAAAPQRRAAPRRHSPGAAAAAAADVQVRSEPGPYGDGPHGLRRFLLDSAVATGMYRSADSEHSRERASERLETHQRHTLSDAADVHMRAVAMSDLGGIVNPQFDPSRISRGVYDAGVTTQLLTRYPIWAEGDSLTLPRVTTRAASAVQTEGAAYADTKVATSPVKADLFTVACKSEISLQAIERATISTELLSDEMDRAWMEQLNSLVLVGQGTAADPDEPLGLLQNPTARNSQRIAVTDAAATPTKAISYLTGAKIAIWRADRRRPDAHIVSPGVVGLWEEAKTSDGDYLIPPWAAWVSNMGGTGTIPEREGPTSEMAYRRVPIYVDAAMSDSWKADDSGDGAGGDQSRIITMCRSEVPIFYNGPMTMTYEQTLAGTGQVLLVCRGYAAFNPMWRPESWRVSGGTGLKLGAGG